MQICRHRWQFLPEEQQLLIFQLGVRNLLAAHVVNMSSTRYGRSKANKILAGKEFYIYNILKKPAVEAADAHRTERGYNLRK